MTSMSTYDLDRLVANLTAPVPKRVRPPAKPQASWATLKVGQRLRALVAVKPYAARTLFVVRETDSDGATLAPKLHLTDRDWREKFERVRTPSKRRKK